MHDSKRYTLAGAAGMSDVILRTLTEPGGLSVRNMRAPGFRMLQAAMAEEGFRVAAGPLPANAQVVLDNAVVEVGEERLTFVADLLAAGLTYNLPDPLSVTQIEWTKSGGRTGAAKRTMTPSARGENKLPTGLPARLPVYLTTDNFELDIRTLRMSRRVGIPLDTALIKDCTRSVNEAIEDAAINGATTLDGEDLQVAGYSAPGLLNAPDAATDNLTAAAWTMGTTVGATVFSEVQGLIAKLVANKKYGPYRMYVGTAVAAALAADYSADKGDNTIQDRLLKLESLQAIRVADMMPANKVVLIQMTSDVIDVVVGQQPTVIPWTSLDGFTIYNMVMAIMVPRIRSDYNGGSGIAIGTLA